MVPIDDAKNRQSVTQTTPAQHKKMMNRPTEEKQLTMVVNNLLPIYHKYLFAQHFPNFKALIVAETQIEDAINNGTIKIEEASKFKRNFGPF